MSEVSTGTLHEIVKDEEAIGGRLIRVPKLLRRLYFDDALERIRGSVVAAKLTFERGKPERGGVMLEMVQERLGQLIGHGRLRAL